MTQKVIDRLAVSGANKICGRGSCVCSYPCGHTNRKDMGIPLIGNSTTCPLDKYNVQPVQESRPWYRIPVEEVEPTRDELFALCSKCANATLQQDKDGLYAKRTNLDLCLDCPVKLTEEAMDESACEAATEL